MTDHQETIYILDQVTPKPGKAEAFLKAYMDRYAPGARARGMTLEHTWITPPMWLDSESNTLFIVWSLKGAGNWWAMNHMGRREKDVLDWWADADSMIESRKRSFLGNVADIASFVDV